MQEKNELFVKISGRKGWCPLSARSCLMCVVSVPQVLNCRYNFIQTILSASPEYPFEKDGDVSIRL